MRAAQPPLIVIPAKAGTQKFESEEGAAPGRSFVELAVTMAVSFFLLYASGFPLSRE
jgi:hypothetical protein